jgi:hypothetical protein
VQGSFKHLHVLLPTNCKWVKHDSNSLCAKEEFFKGTIVVPRSKLDFRRPQLSQVPLCAIPSSYYSCCWVLVAIATCGEREDDATKLV